MSTRPVLAGRRRLLWLLGVSLAAHLLVLAVIARSKPRPPPAPLAGLSVLLRPAAPTPAAARSSALADRSAARPAAKPPSASPVRARVPRAAAASAALAPATASASTASAAASASGIASWDVVADAAPAAGAGVQPRGMKAVDTPPAARLSYAITVGAAGMPVRAGGEAALEWSANADGYRLQLSGENGVMGELESLGQLTDGGAAPLAVHGAGGADAVGFDWGRARASFSRSGASAVLRIDAQDRASMLMRLAGIGLAGAAQFDGGVELQVAGAAGAATVRFDQLGMETIATALGPIEALHLRQRVAQVIGTGGGAAGKASAARLDVWLAPAHSWLPVQLQLSAADGSVVTQTVTAIDTAP